MTDIGLGGRGGDAVALRPIAPVPPGAVWAGATWVGQLDESELAGTWQHLQDGHQFSRARLVIWRDAQPLGAVEVPVTEGAIDLRVVADRMSDLGPQPAHPKGADSPEISIVVCTRDRPDHLRRCLESLSVLDYPRYEVIVVDNNPASGMTPPVVDSARLAGIRVVNALEPGLSRARNVGLRNARYDIVAFTDDDVTADHRWLANVAIGFSRSRRVACVCGMVPTCELLTPAQDYFDRRVSWAKRWSPAVYRLSSQVPNDHLYPLRVSEFGTGANFAVRADIAHQLGGFDEALGAGAPTGSGEDVDLFLRVLLAGHALVREPSAVVWHSHRETAVELEAQMYGYTLGLSAWIFKLLLRPRTAVLVLTRLVTGLRHLRNVTVVEQTGDAAEVDPGLTGLGRRELAGVLRGPAALAKGRLEGRRAAPLNTGSWRSSRRLAATATALSVVGCVGAVGALPGWLIALAVALFVLIGPGCLAMSFYGELPTYAKTALVPTVGLAVTIVAVTGLLMAKYYDPPAVLLILTLSTAAGGALRWWQIAAHHRVPT